MDQSKYIFLVSKDADKLHNLALAFASDCKIIRVNFSLLILKYYFAKLFCRHSKYGNFDKELYFKLIKNNLRRKKIRNTSVFKWRIINYFYTKLMLTKCHVLKKHIEDLFDHKRYEKILLWNGSLFPQSMMAHIAKSQDVKSIFFENGHFPNTIQADTKGINYNSSVNQNPDFYLNFPFKADDQLPNDIGIRYTKLNYSTETYSLPKDFIFAPFQVPSDMQVLDLSPWVKNMLDFYELLHQTTIANPSLKFVIKEHPSFRILIKDKVTKNPNIIFANGLATKELINKSKAVVTINSTVGIEALLLKKKVLTLGLAMYNLPGLVLNVKNAKDFLNKVETIDQWNPDPVLREQFLKHLYNYFLIKGSYQEVTSDMLKRVQSL